LRNKDYLPPSLWKRSGKGTFDLVSQPDFSGDRSYTAQLLQSVQEEIFLLSFAKMNSYSKEELETRITRLEKYADLILILSEQQTLSLFAAARKLSLALLAVSGLAFLSFTGHPLAVIGSVVSIIAAIIELITWADKVLRKDWFLADMISRLRLAVQTVEDEIVRRSAQSNVQSGSGSP
jgi:hypothetical protein